MASSSVTSQTWEPAARIWDVEIIPLIVQVPGGPPLIQIRGMTGIPKTRAFPLYNLTTLTSNSLPFERQLGFNLLSGSGDFNGNGFPDYKGLYIDSGNDTGAITFDAFTPLEKFTIPSESNPTLSGFDLQ
ncbi:MAG: hypothetical protein HQ472_11030 [Ignavibacteria bacterium]|nr:hypothetical protein [Ignavibacteria bacterium]